MTKQTRANVLRGIQRQLRDAAIEDWRQTAEWILLDVLGCSRTALYTESGLSVSAREREALGSAIMRRIEGEPVQYILGHTDFMGLRLRVTPDVLIPRPETEQLVEFAARLADGRDVRILDVGTGSGCIAIGLKTLLPAADVAACDVSTAALNVAQGNALSHGLSIDFKHCDLRSPTTFDWAVPFDLVVSNPPYVSIAEQNELQREVIDHEPHIALFTQEDPLVFYQALGKVARDLLVDTGWLVVEVHEERARPVSDLLRTRFGFGSPQIVKDLAGKDRIVAAPLRGHN